jgi:hypothetical protein
MTKKGAQKLSIKYAGAVTKTISARYTMLQDAGCDAL